MERNVDMNELSDGKRYTSNDMVKIGCGDCLGCSACCRGMGKSIVLDPLDIYRLTVLRGRTFEKLMQKHIELNVVDGIILPNLKLAGESESCTYLDKAGRCSIHQYRPGMCRMFPLGRIYHDRSFDYFLQKNECVKEGTRTKVKIKKWLDTDNLSRYEEYISEWHYLLKDIEKFMKEKGNDNTNKDINIYLLQTFFMVPYTKDDFYKQFEERISNAKRALASLGVVCI